MASSSALPREQLLVFLVDTGGEHAAAVLRLVHAVLVELVAYAPRARVAVFGYDQTTESLEEDGVPLQPLLVEVLRAVSTLGSMLGLLLRAWDRIAELLAGTESEHRRVFWVLPAASRLAQSKVVLLRVNELEGVQVVPFVLGKGAVRLGGATTDAVVRVSSDAALADTLLRHLHVAWDFFSTTLYLQWGEGVVPAEELPTAIAITGSALFVHSPSHREVTAAEHAGKWKRVLARKEESLDEPRVMFSVVGGEKVTLPPESMERIKRARTDALPRVELDSTSHLAVVGFQSTAERIGHLHMGAPVLVRATPTPELPASHETLSHLHSLCTSRSQFLVVYGLTKPGSLPLLYAMYPAPVSGFFMSPLPTTDHFRPVPARWIALHQTTAEQCPENHPTRATATAHFREIVKGIQLPAFAPQQYPSPWLDRGLRQAAKRFKVELGSGVGTHGDVLRRKVNVVLRLLSDTTSAAGAAAVALVRMGKQQEQQASQEQGLLLRIKQELTLGVEDMKEAIRNQWLDRLLREHLRSYISAHKGELGFGVNGTKEELMEKLYRAYADVD